MKTCAIFASLFLLIGCTTAQYRNELSSCERKAMQEFPIDNVKELQNVQIPNKVPTVITCIPIQGAAPICTQQYVTTFTTVAQIKEIDNNKEYRKKFRNSCLKQVCLEKYGNSDCKPSN